MTILTEPLELFVHVSVNFDGWWKLLCFLESSKVAEVYAVWWLRVVILMRVATEGGGCFIDALRTNKHLCV